MACLRIILCVIAGIFLMYSTAASVYALVSNDWFTTSIPRFPGIGISCVRGLACPRNPDFEWAKLITTEQKAVAGLLIASIGCGAVALFFLAWAIVCCCCLLRVGGVVAAFFAFLQFACVGSATVVFAYMWDWSAPIGYNLGPGYISAMVAIPLALLAAPMAAYQPASKK